MLRKARDFANTARDELRDELGPEYADLELRDLDPRTIVRKHIIEAMDEDDDAAGPPARTAPAARRRGPAVRRRRDLTLRRSRLCTAASRAEGDQQDRPPLAARDLDEVGADPAHRLVRRAVAQVHARSAPGVGEPAQRGAQAEPGDR